MRGLCVPLRNQSTYRHLLPWLISLYKSYSTRVFLFQPRTDHRLVPSNRTRSGGEPLGKTRPYALDTLRIGPDSVYSLCMLNALIRCYRISQLFVVDCPGLRRCLLPWTIDRRSSRSLTIVEVLIYARPFVVVYRPLPPSMQRYLRRTHREERYIGTYAVKDNRGNGDMKDLGSADKLQGQFAIAIVVVAHFDCCWRS